MKRNIQLKQFSLSLFIFSLLMTLFTGCDGEKDLKIIDGLFLFQQLWPLS